MVTLSRVKLGCVVVGWWVVLVGAAPTFACGGDCSGDARVTVDEVLVGVNLALGDGSLSTCRIFDQNNDGEVTVDELLAAVSSALGGCPALTIDTVVGSGAAGLNGDGLPGRDTALYLPQDVTIAPDGELYFADWNNHRVRRVRDGIVETVAGTGNLGDAPDGPALYSSLNHPTNICFDTQGDILMAAWHNSLVKRLEMQSGSLVNVAGTGARSYGGDGGPANSAILDLPSSVAVLSTGEVVISDQANFRIRKVKLDGTIETICGTGRPGYSGDGGPCLQAELNSPVGQAAPPAGRIVVDAQDRIYIADTGNHVIRRIDTDGTIDTIAGTGEPGLSGDGGPATAAQLDTPSDVAVGSNGVIYIADTMNHLVRMITTDGTITTIAGTATRGFAGDGGPAADAVLDRPYGVEVGPDGDVWVADTHNHRIRQISADAASGPRPTPIPTPTPEIIPCTGVVGSICTYAGTGQSGVNGDGKNRLETILYWPFDIIFTKTGRRIVLDWNNHLVREILEDETFLTLMGTDFLGDGPPDLSDLTPEGADGLTVNLNHPTDVEEMPDGDLVVMAWHNHKIRVIDSDDGRVRVVLGGPAGFRGDGGPAKDVLVSQAPHLAIDANGNGFMIDQRNQRIRVLYDFVNQRQNAIVTTVVGTGVRGFNGDGLARETQLAMPFGPNPEPSGGIAVDERGVVYFSDTLNHRIRRVEFLNADFTQGLVTTIAGTGVAGFSGDGGPAQAAQVNFPQDLEIGPDGNLYFADANNNRVRKIDLTTGVISTIAGTGVAGYSGDAGPAAEAQLQRPFGVAFDDAGDLYISDTYNGRIRKVEF